MYAKIKALADEAIALQNKDRMDAVLREISACCDRAMEDNSYVDTAPQAGLLEGVSAKDLWPAVKEHFDAKYPGDAALAAAQPGDTIQATGISISDGAGNEEILSVKVTPAKGKKGGAK